MSLIVQKFGGTSVATMERIFNVAKIITNQYRAGNDMVAVVSAQGDTTDDLIEKAKKVNENASKREMDVLLSSGEQISASLLSMAIERLGFPVVSLLGWQAGVKTSSTYGNAIIKSIDTNRIKKEIDKKNIVIVSGFQGINRYCDVTTLGRGGSDTSAVALAAALNADICKIYTDVNGVYTADPRLVRQAKKLSSISYNEMLELATLGAQVLNNRSVEIAKKYNVELEVLCSLNDLPGTVVKEVISLEKMLISGVAKDDNISVISVYGIPDVPGWAFRIFSKLSSKDINIDIILQSAGEGDTKDILFTVSKEKEQDAVNTLKRYCESLKGTIIKSDNDMAKVSIVGAGMETHPGIASKMFEALYLANINIKGVATSEIKISVLVDKNDADEAVLAIHDAFFNTIE